MAKRTNVIRILTNEIERGNTIILSNGNIVSSSLVENGIKEEYIKSLRNNTIPMTTNYADYLKDAIGNTVKAEELLSLVQNFLGTYEEVTNDTKEEKLNPVHSETVPNSSEPKNHPKKKGDK